VARLDDAEGGEGAQAGTDGGAADADAPGQLPLRREPVSWPEMAALDQLLEVGDDPFGGERIAITFGDRGLSGHTAFFANPILQSALQVITTRGGCQGGRRSERL
jgi:hypothetical protein